MVYPGQFHRLVMIGTQYAETWNMTLAIVPSGLGELGMPAVDDATLTAVAGDVAAWWIKSAASGGIGFSAHVKLTSIKLNRIGANGRYVDPTTKEHIYPSPLAGDMLTGFPPPQSATAVTFRTAIERGRGSRGRMYLPSSSFFSGNVGSDGRLASASALGIATGTKVLLTSLNTRYNLVGRVGVASNAGTGRFEHVTRVECGRVVDTIRSRRTSLAEDHQGLAV